MPEGDGPAKRKPRRGHEKFDFKPLIKGVTMLKMGRSGPAHEKLFQLTPDKRFVVWTGRWFSPKFGAICKVDMERVVRLQSGQMTYKFERLAHIFGLAKEKSFSIIYTDQRGDEQSLDLIAPTLTVYKNWFKGLKTILEEIQDERLHASPEENFLKQNWAKADKDNSGALSFDEIIKLVAELNANLSDRAVREMFNRVDESGDGKLQYAEFKEFVRILRSRPELDYTWNLLINGQHLKETIEPLPISKDHEVDRSKHVITMEDFLGFWNAIQGETLSAAEAFEGLTENVPTTFKAGLSKNVRNDYAGFEVTRLMFNNFMSSPQYNEVFDPFKTTVYQDMKQPLSAYYMSSSHNTYLEGDQLTSHSSVNRYVNDLLLGCRSVELDCWDGDAGEPVIYHGRTVTTKIFLRDVCAAIEEYGFQSSPYPLILSIENHCGPEQQRMMAQIFKSAFKSRLVLPSKGLRELPSPDQLKGKVILKGKRNEAEIRAAAEAENDASQRAANQKPPDELKHADQVVPELADITFLGTTHVKVFNADADNKPVDLISSYNESRIMDVVSKPDVAMSCSRYNRSHLTRVYPKNTRIDSSNYNPGLAWSVGSQLVAINNQTKLDVNTMANFGRFRENGMSGYVLKPEYLRMDNARPSPAVRLTVHVISAQQLPKPKGGVGGEIIDPYVIVSITGGAGDEASFKTATVNDNGFNPVFNEVFAFNIRNPDVAVLNLVVWDEDMGSSDFVGFSSLPVSCMRAGVRTVALFDQNGARERDFSFATLCVRVGIEAL